MRPNFAQDAPPTSIEVGGFSYPVNVDFRVWIEVLKQARNVHPRPKTQEEAKKLLDHIQEIEKLVFGDVLVDEDPFETLGAILKFSQGYPKPPTNGGGSSSDRAYSFEYDINYIIIAIRNQSGIDLSYRRTEPFHWWLFLLEFQTLCGEHYILSLMEARTYKGKDKDLLRRKYACALPEECTEEEQAELDEFNAQFT